MDEQIDELLARLDIIAREVDDYEYGLPRSNDEAAQEMRKCVWDWLIENRFIANKTDAPSLAPKILEHER